MADANTTDSASTTETAPAATEAANPNPTSSTTENPNPTPSAEDEAPSTILGGATTDEETPEDTRTDDEKAADEARAALFGAPEGDYEIVGLPEGTVIDTEALAAATPIAKELGLSNEGFSKLASVYAEKILPGVTQQVTDTIMSQAEAQRADWGKDTLEAVKTDPAYGGAPLKDVQAAAAKAIERFGGAELRQYLEDTGLGNHPSMVKAFFLAGTTISEDTSFERGGVTPQPKTSVEKFYGKQT